MNYLSPQHEEESLQTWKVIVNLLTSSGKLTRVVVQLRGWAGVDNSSPQKNSMLTECYIDLAFEWIFFLD
jgi:hypothetical protein